MVELIRTDYYALAGIFVVMLVVKAVITQMRNPLNKFPGPWLAARTWLYRWYYDIYLGGEFLNHLGELHKQYGPVVRIGPNELHFSSPEAFDDIYCVGSKFTKDPGLYDCFGMREGIVGAIDPVWAKNRRDVLSPLFSRRAINNLEGVIQEKVDMLIESILHPRNKNKAINYSLAVRCATLDIITSYCFGKPVGALEREDFSHPIVTSLVAMMSNLWASKYWPFLMTVMRSVPESIVGYLQPQTKGSITMYHLIRNDLLAILADPDFVDRQERETVYSHLLVPQPKKGFPEVPRVDSLLQEALGLIGAGGETVGNTTTNGTFHILSNPHMHKRLVEELQAAWPNVTEDRLKFDVLGKLPYLTAVIKESLRIAPGTVTPLARIAPFDCTVGGYEVPAGTSVASGTTFVLSDPTLFPNPEKFDPERWLQPDSGKLDYWMVAFSKGPRVCIGQNLAYTELYLLFANLFRKVDMKIHETTIEDLRPKEYFTSHYEGRPLQVFVKEIGDVEGAK
jgi:cytochrome P450